MVIYDESGKQFREAFHRKERLKAQNHGQLYLLACARVSAQA